MGRLKLKKKDRPVNVGVSNAALVAMEVYKEQMRTRKELAQNAEILNMMDRVDSNREMWMWGLFAIVLHRRYRYTAKTLCEILSEVQALHEELYDAGMTGEQLVRHICEICKTETGLDLVNDDHPL